MGPGLQILPSSQGSQADPTVQDGPCIPWGQGAHGGPAVPAAELPGPGPPGLPPRGPCHHHCCQTGMGASEMYQEDQEVRLIQGALPGQGGPSRQGLQLGLGSPGCQGVQLTPLGLLGLEVPLQTYQAPALQALPSLPLAPGVRGQPAAGAPGSVAYEVWLAPSLEISGPCEASESEARPSVLSRIPGPSVHKTDRQLGRPGQ